jgi:alkylation response protein AidB-like acyl-CoA dehydrogenase
VLGYYRQLPGGVELRLHDTPLYNSVYRFDDEMLVNGHAYGILAAYTPVMHLFAAAENIQVHGGIGFTWVHPARLYFRRAKSSELLFGGPAVYHERLLDRLGI